jgi:hypothetical protein
MLRRECYRFLTIVHRHTANCSEIYAGECFHPEQEAALTRLAIWACDDDHITIGIAEPDFPVSRGRVEVRLQNDFSAQFLRSIDRGVKVIDLKPKHHAVPGRRGVSVDKVGMVLFVPGVKLKNQAARGVHAIIKIAVTVIGERVCRQQFPVPSAARPDITYGNQRLSFDGHWHAE